MTKAELVKTFQEATQLPTKQAQEYLERFGDIAAAELLGGGEIPLPGVGKIVIRKRAARKVRNPRTGATIDIPARRVLAVNLSKNFKEAFN
ncbi:HU family DNA-binding protein [Desulfovibrio desulfuricans]|uniref:HU family DNA-binding protein n=1 Tax=Desulfovibrio desulfuricans TaxID=876 RepID=UPI0021099181|nr:HU family DNA-binding protein [Desulfovibrio desulfuricans]MCQ4861139.1 HU family DNA-binding protein [Desulfovibrio desulfuricans]